VDLLHALAHGIDRFAHTGPSVPAVFVYLMAAAVPAALLHELGHGLMAAWRFGGPVHVSVGGARKLLRVPLRRLAMAAGSPAEREQVGPDPFLDAMRGSAREVMLVALAGPAASLLGFALAAGALSLAPAGGSWHDFLWAATGVSLLGVLTIVPLKFEERRGGSRVRTDGRMAFDALRAARALRRP
jgi:hypothetical protein